VCIWCVFLLNLLCSHFIYLQNYFKIKNNQIENLLTHTLLPIFADKFSETLKGVYLMCFSVKFVMFSFYLFAKLFQNKKQKQPNWEPTDTHPFTHFCRQIFRNVKGCVLLSFMRFSVCSHFINLQNYFKLIFKNNQMRTNWQISFYDFCRQIFRNVKGCVLLSFMRFSVCSHFINLQNYFKLIFKNNQMRTNWQISFYDFCRQICQMLKGLWWVPFWPDTTFCWKRKRVCIWLFFLLNLLCSHFIYLQNYLKIKLKNNQMRTNWQISFYAIFPTNFRQISDNVKWVWWVPFWPDTTFFRIVKSSVICLFFVYFCYVLFLFIFKTFSK
jgi:hypothetical protein